MTAHMRVLLVDDEAPARAILREYLAPHSNVSILAECTNGFEAVKAVTEMKPDLLFLDIQMPKLNGFEVLDLLEDKPSVIFVTAYEQYALKAFEIHAVDYLLKPFSQERFNEALEHARWHKQTTGTGPINDLLAAVRTHNGPVDRIPVRDGSLVHIIAVDRIDYIEALDDYVRIVFEGKKLLKHVPLSAVEATLDPRRFVKIHRSFVLNIDRLAKIELYARDSRIAILRDGTQLHVSRGGYERLRGLL